MCTSVAPLLNADLRGNPVGAVHDFIWYVNPGNIRRIRRQLFLANDAPYLQSGVMVFDWPSMLDNGGLKRAREFLARHPDRCLEAPDQHALNASLEGRWTPLDPRWNLHELSLIFGRKNHTPYIEHYTTRKPWSRLRFPAWRNAAEWYKGELADTAWASFVQRQSALDLLHTQLLLCRRCWAPKIFQGLTEGAPRIFDGLAKHAPFILDMAGFPRTRDESESGALCAAQPRGRRRHD